MALKSHFERRVRSGFAALWILVGPIACSLPQEGPEPPEAAPEEVRKALKQAVEFFRSRVSNSGGYHFRYAFDLSYGRSEAAPGADPGHGADGWNASGRHGLPEGL